MTARKSLFTEFSRIAGAVLLVSSLIGGALQAGASSRPVPGAQSTNRGTGGGTAQKDSAQTPLPRHWWNDASVRKELKLSDEKARLIEGIFQKRLAEARAWWEQLQREQERLERMTAERVADEATYALQVSKVEAIAARLREGRTVMLYRIYLELQPEQFRKLQDMMDRGRNEARGRGPGSGR